MTIRRRERTRYVFTFGRARSGKSTLLASVTQHIASNRDVALIRNPLRPDGYTIVNRDWLGAIRAKEFPPESVSGELVEVDIGIKLLAAPKHRELQAAVEDTHFTRLGLIRVLDGQPRGRALGRDALEVLDDAKTLAVEEQ